MKSRWSVVACVLCAVTAVQSQVTPAERKGIADSLSVGNFSLADLRFERKPFKDTLRMKFIETALDDPMNTANEYLAWHASAAQGTVSALLATCYSRGFGEQPRDTPPTAKSQIPAASAIPPNIRSIVEDLVAALQACDAEIRGATANLKPEEKRELIEGLPVWAVEEPKVTFSFVKLPPPRQERLLSLLAKVDLTRIRQAGQTLTAATEKARIALTGKDALLAGVVRESVNGLPVEIGGQEDDTFSSTDTRLTIDLGGNDRYTGRVGAGVGYSSVLLDLSGNDVYDCRDLSTGAGVLGVGVAFDGGGNDSFRGQSLGFGAGLAGVGVFMKNGGDDYYSSIALSQGFGLFGVGLCLDTGGNDDYRLKLFGQGASRTQGVGWLIDRGGDDDYRAGGLSMNEPLFTGVAYSNAQGYSAGYREDTGGLSGGIALLTDLSGQDHYLAETYAQAASYWFATSSLYDASGNDSYTGHHYVQASAMHCCSSYLFDLDGSDAYVTKVGASLAIGHDYGVAFFLDRAGDDLYTARDSTPGVGVANGLGIFVDSGGIDRYDGPPGQGNAARGTGSLGVFVDLGGQDKYRSGLGDGIAVTASVWGTALDFETPTMASNEVTAKPAPQAGSKAKPSDAELEKLYRKATQWGVGSAQQDVTDATNEMIAIGVPAFEWMLSQHLASSDRLQQRLFVSVAKALGPAAGPAVGDKALHGNISEKRNLTAIAMEAGILDVAAVIPSYLDVPELQLVAAKAAGLLKAKAAVPNLMKLCMGSDRLLSRAAMVSMVQIGDESAVGTAQAMLRSTDLPTRMAALQLLSAFPAHAKIVAEELIESSDEVQARIGMQLTASQKTPEGLMSIARLLLDPRPGVRIEALQLLKGRVPPEFEATVTSLEKDPDEVVRAVARGLKTKP